MTKLMEWLAGLAVLLAIYVALVTRQIKTDLTEAWMFEIQIAPIVAVALFGVSDFTNLFYIIIANCILGARFNAIFLSAPADLLSAHYFVPNVHIQRLSRCGRWNPTTNKRSKRGFGLQRTEIMNGQCSRDIAKTPNISFQHHQSLLRMCKLFSFQSM